MAICKFCGVPFGWGQTDAGRWVPMIPVGEEGDAVRDYQDEHGALRSSHAQVCIRVGGPSVRVAKLASPIPAGEVLGAELPEPALGPSGEREAAS